MSHEDGSETGQRTVAELLAKYGGSGGERAPRRRRRRPDDLTDTGAQAIIERVMSESGEMPVIREDQAPPERTSHRHRNDTGRHPLPPKRDLPQRGAGPGGPVRPAPMQQPSGYHQAPGRPPRQQPPPQAPSQPLPTPPPQAPSQPLPLPPMGARSNQTRSNPALPGPPAPTRPGPSGSNPALPAPPGLAHPTEHTSPVRPPRRPGPVPPGPRPGAVPPGQQTGRRPMPMAPPPVRPDAGREPVTEEMPRIGLPDELLEDRTLHPPPGEPPMELADPLRRVQFPPAGRAREVIGGAPLTDLRTQAERELEGYGEFEPDDYDQRAVATRRAGGGEFDDLDDRYDYDDRLDDDRLDDEDGLDVDDPDEITSPAREWLVMVGQLALGVLGGAAVWLGFNWLWGTLPQAALVVALLVIVGLVLIVRKIRRADDLQTTVLAVLVGLVVTVSPAVLLLLGR